MARGGGGDGWAAQNHHRLGQPLPRPGPRPDLEGVRRGSQPAACRPPASVWAPRVAAAGLTPTLRQTRSHGG